MPSVQIKGTIVSNDDDWIYDYFGIENTSPRKVRKALEEANGENVTIEINSGGGDVFAGNEIYYLISNYKGKTTADLVGLVASAATVISCAADEVRAVPGMQYMIHNVSTSAHGDYNAMDHASEILQNANKSISNIYRLKTGMTEKELLELMNKETWMDVEKAKEFGFIDTIIGDNGLFERGPITINNSVATILSGEVKEKIRNSVKNPAGEDPEPDFLIQRNKLNLLKLKGAVRNVEV